MKRNLFKELNIEAAENAAYTALDADIRNVKNDVCEKTTSASRERKSNFMKSKKKFSLIAAAAALALGATVFAAGGIVKTWVSSSSAIPDYKTLPSEEKLVSDVGYAVALPEAVGGYYFKDGSVEKNTLYDENGNPAEKFKSVSFRYEKDGDIVYFSQKRFNSETDKEGEVIATENGCDIYGYAYTNKLVPPGYEMTDEDKKAEEAGELVFSYGSSEVEISSVQSVVWDRDGTECCLMQIDGKLSSEELCDMAREIIDG